MQYNLDMVATDFTLVRDRFLRRLWGNAGPRSNLSLTCSQNISINGICAVNTVLHSMKFCLRWFSPTLSSGGRICHRISGYLLTFRVWWDFSSARLLNRNNDITKITTGFCRKVQYVKFQAHSPGECWWLLRRACGQGGWPPVLNMRRGWFASS